MSTYKPLLLVILDGFGVSLEREGNPVTAANTPTINTIEQNFPFTTLRASEVAVGLPWGEAGNSEVGHLTMGAGRVIYHHLPRIIYSIRDGSFFQNPAFLKAAEHVKKNHSRLHIAGLVSSGSVHSYIDHLYALLDFAKGEGIEPVFIHAFSDGKDAPPQEAGKFYQTLAERIQKQWPNAQLSSVVGRTYALDRDEVWERVRVAYELLTEGKGKIVASIPEHVRESYARGVTDEFIEPAVLGDAEGRPVGTIQSNDALIFLDFREDSIRELTHAFVDDAFDHFPRTKIQNLLTVTMTEYQKGLTAIPAFPQLDIRWPLARVLSDAGLRHLHIAETQKYAHVTYFFNSGWEQPFPGEERILVPSLPTPHADEVPEMKAREITQKILENMEHRDVIIANYANADMVGHTGNFEAATRSVEILDESLSELMNAILNSEGAMLVTGDHGNIELKRNTLTGEKLTEHSINPVPLYLIGKTFRLSKPRSPEEIIRLKSEVGGILTDVAPTLLDLLGLKKPEEMTGTSLVPLLTKQQEGSKVEKEINH